MIGVVFGKRFKTVKKLRDGSFPEMFEGENTHTGEKVVIKLEPDKAEHPQLKKEHDMYCHLKGGPGIPRVKGFDVEHKYRFLVIEPLGPSLEDLLKQRGDEGHFSLKTVLMLADQIIDTLIHIQEKGVIHRDIKPESLLMGVGSNAYKVYLIDFGLANYYSHPITDEHIPYREDAAFVGTHSFASLYTHCGIEQSRRDDAESLCFVLMYLLKGSLPWQGKSLGSNDEENNATISNLKFEHTQPKELLKKYPPEFEECFGFARYVSFHSAPYLLSMKSAFRKLFESEGCVLDHVYDWTTTPEDDIKLRTSSELATEDSSSENAPSSKDASDVPKKQGGKNQRKNQRKNRHKKRHR